MPTAATQKSRPNPIALEQVLAANQKQLASAAQINARMMHDMLLMQKHMVDFVSRRLQRDVETAEKLCKCGAAPDMVSVAQEFCATAMTDYAEEANALMKLGAEMTSKTLNGAAEAARVEEAAKA